MLKSSKNVYGAAGSCSCSFLDCFSSGSCGFILITRMKNRVSVHDGHITHMENHVGVHNSQCLSIQPWLYLNIVFLSSTVAVTFFKLAW